MARIVDCNVGKITIVRYVRGGVFIIIVVTGLMKLLKIDVFLIKFKSCIICGGMRGRIVILGIALESASIYRILGTGGGKDPYIPSSRRDGLHHNCCNFVVSDKKSSKGTEEANISTTLIGFRIL